MANFIKKFKNLFKNEDIISKDEAEEIQKEHILSTRKKIKAKHVFTPTYMLIAKQIYDENDQIVRCAIFKISDIAMSSKKYRAEILELFAKYLNSKRLKDAHKKYIAEKIEHIKTYKNEDL